MVSRKDIADANAVGKALLKASPTALAAHYEPKIGQVIITLNTGLQFLLDPAKTEGLQNASRAALRRIAEPAVSVRGWAAMRQTWRPPAISAKTKVCEPVGST